MLDWLILILSAKLFDLGGPQNCLIRRASTQRVDPEAVTFRKGVTPWLRFRRPSSTVASVPSRDHPSAD